MIISQYIQDYISKFVDGTTFKYDQLAIQPRDFPASAKAIERLIKKGVVKRISTGVFYKPKKTVFGELTPQENEILKPYLFKNGKRIAYVTGASLYNRLGLTTQIPNSIKIASRDKRITISCETVKASPVKSYVDVTDKNFHLLELLDVLKDFKKIADLDKVAALKILSFNLKNLTPTETKVLIKCSLSYPPRVRSFLGALLEQIKTSCELTTLKNSLNPLSEYDYGIEKKVLPTVVNWSIK